MRLFIAFMTSILILSGSSFVSDAQASPAGDFLVEAGENYYDSGRIEDAVHEFSKALMIDPDNILARKYLRELGFHTGLYQNHQTSQSKIVDLTAEIKEYQQRIAALALDKMMLEERFRDLQAQNEHLESLQQARTLERDHLSGRLEDLKVSSSRQIDQIQDYYRERNRDLVLRMTPRSPSVAPQQLAFSSIIFDEDVTNLRRQYNDLQEERFAQKVQEDALFMVVDDYLTIRQDELNKMKNDVIGCELDLCHSKSDLLHKQDELIEMYQQK